jgi:hypothetical protein
MTTGLSSGNPYWLVFHVSFSYRSVRNAVRKSSAGWFQSARENGRKVLDYMEADERFSAASFKDSVEEQRAAVNKNDLITLIDNMRSLSKQWRSSIGEHGELVFYIDAC